MAMRPYEVVGLTGVWAGNSLNSELLRLCDWAWQRGPRPARRGAQSASVSPLVRLEGLTLVGQGTGEQALYSLGDPGLVVVSHQIDSVAIRVAPMPVLVDFLAHPKG